MRLCRLVTALTLLLASGALAQAEPAPADNVIVVPIGRSTLFGLPAGAQAQIDNPGIAETHSSSPSGVIITGKRLGRTSLRVFDQNNGALKQVDVVVGYDLPAVRKAVKAALPEENINVDMGNAGLVLGGQVTSSAAADRVMKAAGDSLRASLPPGEEPPAITSSMQVAGGGARQVVLHVRVGEISRDALTDLNSQLNAASAKGSPAVADLMQGLEKQGLFKSLVEPSLTTASGEETGFTAGGKLMLPSMQAGSNANVAAMQDTPFDMTVKFTPVVMPDNRIHLTVQPEVPEIVTPPGGIPSVAMRRSKTEVDLASGESFVLAGLMRDQTRAIVAKLPGARDMPVLGQLFKSQSFQQNQSDMVITVTPYLVDPLQTAGVKPPTSSLRATQPMEKFFFDALAPAGQTPVAGVEGPVGFMTD